MIKRYPLNSRGTSIKTRIETGIDGVEILNQFIQEAHPLKQGLKLNAVGIAIRIILFKRHIH